MTYLYPECQNCGKKADEDQGVNIIDFSLDNTFNWCCPRCQYRHKGEFGPETNEEVEWISVEKPLAERILDMIWK